VEWNASIASRTVSQSKKIGGKQTSLLYFSESGTSEFVAALSVTVADLSILIVLLLILYPSG
jgi:hypothetical protein